MKEFIEKHKTWVTIYIIWSAIHLILLFMITPESDAGESFYPLGNQYDTLYRTYDFSEFLVYVFGPLLILVLVIFNKKDKK